MESIEELREQLQKSKVDGRERPWGYRFFQRGPSIYITRVLLRTSATPNQVTFGSILVGIAGAYCVYALPGIYKLIGLLLLYLNILLDKVDGEIARYRGTHSLRGIYLDEVNHLAIPPLFFLAMTFGLGPYIIFELRILTIAGSIAAISMPLIRVGHSFAPQIFAKKYLKRPELFPLPRAGTGTDIERIKKERTFLRFTLGIVHQFQEFFMILLVFSTSVVGEYFLRYDYAFYPFTSLALLGYGALLPLICIENSIKGFFSIERRILGLREKFLERPNIPSS